MDISIDERGLLNDYSFLEFIEINKSGLSIAYEYMMRICSSFSNKNRIQFYHFIYRNSTISEKNSRK